MSSSTQDTFFVVWDDQPLTLRPTMHQPPDLQTVIRVSRDCRWRRPQRPRRNMLNRPQVRSLHQNEGLCCATKDNDLEDRAAHPG